MNYGNIEKELSGYIEASAREVFADLSVTCPPGQDLRVELEIPRDPSHGDISTNIAMKSCKTAGIPAADLAARVKDNLDILIGASPIREFLASVEVKPPGFINIFFSDNYLCRVLLEIQRRDKNFGRSNIGRGQRLHIEFVSANPTGPLTIAHGRQAAVGDSLAGILEFNGYRVTREYYLNDEGTQMDILARSVRARYLELMRRPSDFPSDGYKGSYVMDIAKDFRKKYGAKFVKSKESDLDSFREFGLRWILRDIKKDLKDFKVRFDVWYSQRVLRKSGKVRKAIGILKDKGYIYENEGAVWFKSTSFGDDKDRVVIKSDGSATYLAPDIAYHLEKFRRGFRRLVDIWGPDHHGYVPRMKAAVQALGFPGQSLSVLIVQLATLYRHGQVVSMSTRAGEFVTLREVMDEVGSDVTRFCFLMRKLSSHLDFDMDVIKKESSENPVYYIQYAHARIWSIMEHSRKEKVSNARFDSRLLKEAEEIMLARMLGQFPHLVELAARLLEPYVILQYLQDLAAVFHSFYTKHRVVGEDPHLTKSRLILVDCVRIVLANGLRLLGVSLPKKM